MPGSKPKAGRWKKGESGNPSGRAKTPECFKANSEAAQRKIIQLMNSTNAELAFKAAALIVAYNLGKPTEHHDMTSDGGPLTIILKEYRANS